MLNKKRGTLQWHRKQKHATPERCTHLTNKLIKVSEVIKTTDCSDYTDFLLREILTNVTDFAFLAKAHPDDFKSQNDSHLSNQDGTFSSPVGQLATSKCVANQCNSLSISG